MRIYSIWDYMAVAADIIVMVGLLGILYTMGLLLYYELKKYK